MATSRALLPCSQRDALLPGPWLPTHAARRAPTAMTTALYLILSGVLIGAGVSIIWRDVRKKSRGAFVSGRDAHPLTSADVEVTIARDLQPELPRRAPPPAEIHAPLFAAAPRAHLSPLPELAKATARDGAAPTGDAAPWLDRGAPARSAGTASPTRLSVRLALEQQWSQLQSAIATGIARTNALVAPMRLCIGPAGEPAWSYKHRGYGAHRRLLIGEESVAWLRLELLAEGQLRAHVKAHREDRASLNASAE